MTGRIEQAAARLGRAHGRIAGAAYRWAAMLCAAAIELWRNAAPSILMVGTIITGFMLGAAGASGWFLIAPIAFGSFAIGLAADRAEARGRNATGNAFLRMLEDDRTINVIVTHNKPVSSPPRTEQPSQTSAP